MRAALYRERLVLEGFVLAGSGALGAAVLLVFVEESRERPGYTLAVLAAVALLCGLLAPRLARKWTERAEPAPEGGVTGDPTPLWQLPAIVAGLAVLAGVLSPQEWEASLRVTGGCVLVGLTQAVLMARIVERAERREGRRYVRLPGSRLLRGTRLGYL